MTEEQMEKFRNDPDWKTIKIGYKAQAGRKASKEVFGDILKIFN